MINHAPVLKGAEVEMHGDTPFLAVKLEKPHQNIGDKKFNEPDDLRIEEFDKVGKRFKIMLGWMEKQS